MSKHIKLALFVLFTLVSVPICILTLNSEDAYAVEAYCTPQYKYQYYQTELVDTGSTEMVRQNKSTPTVGRIAQVCFQVVESTNENNETVYVLDPNGRFVLRNGPGIGEEQFIALRPYNASDPLGVAGAANSLFNVNQGSGKAILADCDTRSIAPGNGGVGDKCPGAIGYKDLVDANLTAEQVDSVFRKFFLEMLADAADNRGNNGDQIMDPNSICLLTEDDKCINPEDPDNPDAALTKEEMQEYRQTVQESLSGTNTPSCYTAAKGLGWIACVLSENGASAVEYLYDNFIEGFLTVDPALFGGGNSATYSAWQTFQTFANIAFVIMMIVVIFSQLTGIGIDNYGIKKILPKLIIAIVLINLSYIICEVVIDLSNILGASIKGIFDALPINYDDSEFIKNGLGINDEAEKGIAIVVAIIGAGATGFLIFRSFFVEGGTAAVYVILLAVLAAVLAFLMLFVVLAVREAAVLLLTVISPLAFACYMLPNTKSWFDKWYSMLKAMLIVYPTCGLVVGAGGYAGSLLIASARMGDYFLVIAGIIMTVAPIFMVPSLVKKSMAAIGGIGATVAGLTSRIPAGARQRVANTQRFKEGLDNYNRNRTYARSERLNNRAEKAIANAKRKGNTKRVEQLTKKFGESRRYQAAYNTTQKMDEERRGLQLAAQTRFNPKAKDLLEQDVEAALQPDKKGDIDSNNLSIALSRLQASGDPKAAPKLIDNIVRQSSDVLSNSNATDEQKAAALKRLEALRGALNNKDNEAISNNLATKYSSASQMIQAVDAIRNNMGAKGYRYEDYAANAEKGTEITNLPDRSGGELNNMLASNVLTASKVQDVFNSDDPKIKSMLSDPEKGATFQAAQAAINAGFVDDNGKVQFSEYLKSISPEAAAADAAARRAGREEGATTNELLQAAAAKDYTKTVRRSDGTTYSQVDTGAYLTALGRGYQSAQTDMTQWNANQWQRAATNGTITYGQIEDLYARANNGDQAAVEFFANSNNAKYAHALRQHGNENGHASSDKIDVTSAATKVDSSGRPAVDLVNFVDTNAKKSKESTTHQDIGHYLNMSDDDFSSAVSAGRVRAADLQNIQLLADQGNVGAQKVMEKHGDNINLANRLAESGHIDSKTGTINAAEWNTVMGGGTVEVKNNEGGRSNLGKQAIIDVNKASFKYNSQAHAERTAEMNQAVKNAGYGGKGDYNLGGVDISGGYHPGWSDADVRNVQAVNGRTIITHKDGTQYFPDNNSFHIPRS